MTFTELVDGPFWHFSLAVFLIGVAWRLVNLISLHRHRDLSVERASPVNGAIRSVASRFIPHASVQTRIRVRTVASYLFHIGLFLLLVFAAPHIAFYEERVLGFGWTPMPYWAFVAVSAVSFFGLIVLWLHRVMYPVTRSITSGMDHIATALVFLVMLTGCMALDQSFEGLRVLHLFLAELMLLYFPFSSLMHAFYFGFARAQTGAHYGRRGVKV
jgi:nitrate reductase gamma subunit